jgi:hypothetical protein
MNGSVCVQENRGKKDQEPCRSECDTEFRVEVQVAGRPDFADLRAALDAPPWFSPSRTGLDVDIGPSFVRRSAAQYALVLAMRLVEPDDERVFIIESMRHPHPAHTGPPPGVEVCVGG